MFFFLFLLTYFDASFNDLHNSVFFCFSSFTLHPHNRELYFIFVCRFATALPATGAATSVCFLWFYFVNMQMLHSRDACTVRTVRKLNQPKKIIFVLFSHPYAVTAPYSCTHSQHNLPGSRYIQCETSGFYFRGENQIWRKRNEWKEKKLNWRLKKNNKRSHEL